MQNRSLLTVYTICCLLVYCLTIAAAGPIVFSGSMRFPHTVKKTPLVRIYWSGHRITSEIDTMGKMLHFSIPGLRQQRSLYLVIAKDIFHDP